MANRRRIRRAKHIETVHKHRKLAHRRAMHRDNEQKLVLRLKLLGSGMMIPGRSKLVRDIEKLTLMPVAMSGTMLREQAFRKSYKHKSLNFVINECYRLISIEKDPDILVGLLQLAPVFHDSRLEQSAAFEQYSDVRAVVALLKRFPPIQVRCAAIALLCERYDSFRYEGKLSNDLAFYMCAILTAFRARNSQLPEVAEKWIDEDEEVDDDLDPNWIDPFSYAKTRRWEYAEVHLAISLLKILNGIQLRPIEKYLNADSVSYICRDEDVMSIVFEGIRNWTQVPNKCYDDDYVFCNLLYNLLSESRRDTDREHLITRYEHEMRMAMRGMRAGLLKLLLVRPQVAAIIANDDVILHDVWRRMNNECACGASSHYDSHYHLPVNLLDYCLQTANDGLLQKMLGMGYLGTARYWAIDDSYSWGRAVSDIYRDVLAARPEWKQRFRQLTAVGWRGRRNGYSRTARLGAAIPQSASKSALCVVVEDVDVI